MTMFTGIVEELGTVLDVTSADGVARITVGGGVAADAALGDSIAVNGVCLTVTSRDGDAFSADVMGETLRRTTLGSLQPGESVNLERAATASTRLGGHVVQGHVDGVGTVVARAASGDFDEVTIRLPHELARYVVEKGSIAIDGVSLTVVSVNDDAVVIGMIPETLRRTTLGTRAVGELVNVETDVFAKYVEKLVESRVDQVLAERLEKS